MKYEKVMGIGAIFALCFMLCACFAPGAMGATAGDVTVEGLVSATNEVKANSAEITLNASGTDINQIDFWGGDSLNSMVLLKSYEFNGTNTSVEKVYDWTFTTQGDKVYKLSILDGETWDNSTVGAFTVATYIIPMANSDSALYNLLAFVALFIFVYLAVWLLWLRKNDGTNKGERKEQNKDSVIAIIIALAASVILFIVGGGLWKELLDVVSGWF